LTGQKLCSLVSLDGGKDWLVVSPDGFFDGSKGGLRYVSHRRAGTPELVDDHSGLLCGCLTNDSHYRFDLRSSHRNRHHDIQRRSRISLTRLPGSRISFASNCCGVTDAADSAVPVISRST
jgi:hypothetical protein